MRLSAVAAVLALVAPALSYTMTYTLVYDTMYDQDEISLEAVACSNGEHGLLTRGYQTFGDLPTFPHIGGAPQIMSWNSRYCGTCWEFAYTDGHGLSVSLNFTAIDFGDDDTDGFSISLEGMDVLTNGNALALGEVKITAVQRSAAWCGL